MEIFQHDPINYQNSVRNARSHGLKQEFGWCHNYGITYIIKIITIIIAHQFSISISFPRSWFSCSASRSSTPWWFIPNFVVFILFSEHSSDTPQGGMTFTITFFHFFPQNFAHKYFFSDRVFKYDDEKEFGLKKHTMWLFFCPTQNFFVSFASNYRFTISTFMENIYEKYTRQALSASNSDPVATVA